MLRLSFLVLILLIFQLSTSGSDARHRKHSNHKKFKHTRKASIRQSNYSAPQQGNLFHKTAHVKGQELLEFFNFETTNSGSQGGNAQYVSLEDAYKLNLVQVQGSSVRFNVDTTQYVQDSRKSIRVSSKSVFSSGTMIVVDVAHMPVACGAWPALWTVSRDDSWPNKGEIDIIEGVNMFTKNSISAHTKSGFVMKDNGFTSTFMMDSSLKNNCDVYATGNQGCGLRDQEATTYGKPFNDANGGVFVMDWQDDFITVHFFPRGKVPEDIQAGAPSKSAAWRSSEPRAKFHDVNGQKTSDYFMEHVLVINTNLCGQWPDGVWWADAAYAGQGDSCAKTTGHDSCASYILNAGDQLHEAYWTINSVQMYNS